MTHNAAAAALHTRMLAAHASNDRPALVRHYTQAGNAAEARGDMDAAAFFITIAYVFALEQGAEEADELHAWLKMQGRED